MPPIPLGGAGIPPRQFTPFGLVDWDGDGCADIVGRHDPSEVLWSLSGKCARGPGGWTMQDIGKGWAGPLTPFGIADWDGDGQPDLIVRDERHTDFKRQLLVYPTVPGVQNRVFTPAVQIGSTSDVRQPFGLSDWDRDGRQDLLDRHEDSAGLWLHLGKGVLASVTLATAPLGAGW